MELLAQAGELGGGLEGLQPAVGDAALAVLRPEKRACDGAVGVGVATAGHDRHQAFLEGGRGGERAEGDLHGAQDVTLVVAVHRDVRRAARGAPFDGGARLVGDRTLRLGRPGDRFFRVAPAPHQERDRRGHRDAAAHAARVVVGDARRSGRIVRQALQAAHVEQPDRRAAHDAAVPRRALARVFQASAEACSGGSPAAHGPPPVMSRSGPISPARLPSCGAPSDSPAAAPRSVPRKRSFSCSWSTVTAFGCFFSRFGSGRIELIVSPPHLESRAWRRADSTNSSRSFPQKLRSPTKMVGTPKTPLASARSVFLRSSSFTSCSAAIARRRLPSSSASRSTRSTTAGSEMSSPSPQYAWKSAFIARSPSPSLDAATAVRSGKMVVTGNALGTCNGTPYFCAHRAVSCAM